MLGKKKTIATLFAFKDAAKRTLLGVALLAAWALAIAQSSLSAQNEALFAAARYGTVEEVLFAIKGANVDARDKDGATALMWAASNNANADVVKALIAAGANVNARSVGGSIALMGAARNNANADVVKALIAAGADVNARNSDGLTALMFAADSNTNPDVVKALLNAGSDVNARNKNDWTALMCAAAYNTNPDVVKALLTAGADVNAIGGIYGGFTALMNAASSNTNPDVVKALIDAGANVNAKDNDGKRAIDYLDDRHKSTFYGTDAYWKMRDLLY